MFRHQLDDCRRLLKFGTNDEFAALLAPIGFESLPAAVDRLRRLARSDGERDRLAAALPALLTGFEAAHAPDQSLLHFERLVDAVPDREQLLARLIDSPRQVEILLRLFVSSQFLSDMLIRHPAYLDRLSQHQRMAEVKSPPQFQSETAAAVAEAVSWTEQLDALRRHQQWELLRLAACDTFHLMDLRTVTQQLSRLAEALVQTALALTARDLRIDTTDFAVLAFGKLGGDELNYSSDIDLVFVARRNPERYWKLGQKLIAALNDATELGFLYRVDMRLRPWGKSGPLVTSSDGYRDYLARQARPWELQALLKARPIAGTAAIVDAVLVDAARLIQQQPAESVRNSVRDMLAAIRPSGTTDDLAAEVKSGPGGIRDIEFFTQYLQMTCGAELDGRHCRSTIDALVHLADAELILPGEYQHLSSAYVFQRSVEHALQLMHNRQRYTLPSHPRELRYLAGRLDFPSAEQFLSYYSEHRRFVRDIVQRRFADVPATAATTAVSDDVSRHFGAAAGSYAEAFPEAAIQRQLQLLETLDEETVVRVDVRELSGGCWELTVVGFDQLGDLSLMCGLLFVTGLDIESGLVFTGAALEGAATALTRSSGDGQRKFVNSFIVRAQQPDSPAVDWKRYETELRSLLQLAGQGRLADAQSWLARRVERSSGSATQSPGRLQPLEIAIENDGDPDATRLLIRGEDTPGFLYELCNALATSDVSIQRMHIATQGTSVTDTLYVTTDDGRKITDATKQNELRAAIVLTRHFTHLLPAASSPGAALLHFRELLRDLFRQEHWLDQLASLQQPEVLAALARMFGNSDFLWEDFLRLHYAELFPLVSNLEGLSEPHDGVALQQELTSALAAAATPDERREALNAFKDREMFRIDMRHILGLTEKFGLFSQELTWLTEAVVQGAIDLCQDELQTRFGRPVSRTGETSRLAVCALGKCGGRELGFASDIELLFVYEVYGSTDGPESISHADYFARIAEGCARTIRARQQGIFEIDLRLRPYGNAGPLAVSRDAFERYYAPDGAAWPYERQALVKLRPIAGDVEFGAEIVALRDRLIYCGRPFDLHAMRGLRERQTRELVQAGSFNAKLSPGGVVDCEYFVQALQLAYGHRYPELRTPNTRDALRALEAVGLVPDRRPLRDAYRFLRRLIDALRMVRGNARDLTVPPVESDQFEFLARRLGYADRSALLAADLQRHASVVREQMQRLERLLPRSPAAPAGSLDKEAAAAIDGPPR